MTLLVPFLFISLCPSSSSTSLDLSRLDFNEYYNFADHLSLEKGKWQPNIPNHTQLAYRWSLVTAATPNQCYCPTGVITNNSCTLTQFQLGCKNKTDEGYAWGLTRIQDKVFWGTLANILCIYGFASGHNYICTGDHNHDWHIPSIYMFSETTGITIQLNNQITGIHWERLNRTQGLRAAGNRNGVTILAGPSIDRQSVFMFSFTSKDGTFLDSIEFSGYNDVRRFTTNTSYNMYVGLSIIGNKGAILRYIGDISNSLKFEQIAIIQAIPAELTFLDDYLLVSSWPSTGNYSGQNASPGSILISPQPIDTITTPISDDWRVVWSVSNYEPDPVVSLSLCISMIVEFNGWYYWGTLQATFGGNNTFGSVYGPPVDQDSAIKRLIGTHRAISLFRGKNLQTRNPEIEVLYGEIYFPVYNNSTNTWSSEVNLMQQTPKFGRSGFGNIFNIYTWTIANFNNQLYIGTEDDSYKIASIFNLTDKYYYYNNDNNDNDDNDKKGKWTEYGYQIPQFGADLYVFRKNATLNDIGPAEWVSKRGLSTFPNYGFRNLAVSYDGYDDLIVGTANPFNIDPQGAGWQVYQFVSSKLADSS